MCLGDSPISANLRLDHLLIRDPGLGTWLREEGNAKNAKTAKSRGFAAGLFEIKCASFGADHHLERNFVTRRHLARD